MLNRFHIALPIAILFSTANVHAAPVSPTSDILPLQAIKNDEDGTTSWKYGRAFRDGVGVPANPEAAAFQFSRATLLMPVKEAENRKLLRQDLLSLLEVNLNQLPKWLDKWQKAGEDEATNVLLDSAAGMTGPKASIARLYVLDYIEQSNTPWGTNERRDVLLKELRTVRSSYVNARSLLPWRKNGELTFPTLTEDEAAECWKNDGGYIEFWAKFPDARGYWASIALIARDMGRWPKVSPVQSPQKLIDLTNPLFLVHPERYIALEMRRGKREQQAPWNDSVKGLAWVDEMIRIAPVFKYLKTVYLEKNQP